MVNNNASEQQNHKYNDFRDMPYVKGIIHFMTTLNDIITERQLEAINYSMVNNATVVPPISKKVLEGTDTLESYFDTIKLRITKVEIDRSSGVCQKAIFLISYHSISDRGAKHQHTVAFQPRKSTWTDRIHCHCNYYVSKGMPCYHAAYILVNLNTITAEQKHLKMELTKIIADPIWKYDHETWYSEIYSVKSMIDQYSPPKDCPVEVDYAKLPLSLLLPAPIQPRKGRKRKARFKRRFPKPVRRSARHTYEDSDESSTNEHDGSSNGSSSENDDHDNAADAGGTSMEVVDAALAAAQEHYAQNHRPKIARKIVHCSYCGSDSHISTLCDQKDMSFMLSNSKAAKFVIKRANRYDKMKMFSSFPTNNLIELNILFKSWFYVDGCKFQNKTTANFHALLQKRLKSLEVELSAHYADDNL
jgi:hypothetical protein